MQQSRILPAVIRTLVLVQLIGTAVLSFTSILHVGQRFGLGWHAWTTPFLIDGFALLGMAGRLRCFTAATRRTGLKLMVGAGTVSLACNVYAGSNIGQRIYGVLVVAGALTAEWYASRLTPRRTAAPRTPRSAPVSPGRPMVALTAAEAQAFRDTAEQLGREAAIDRLSAR